MFSRLNVRFTVQETGLMERVVQKFDNQKNGKQSIFVAQRDTTKVTKRHLARFLQTKRLVILFGEPVYLSRCYKVVFESAVRDNDNKWCKTAKRL